MSLKQLQPVVLRLRFRLFRPDNRRVTVLLWQRNLQQWDSRRAMRLSIVAIARGMQLVIRCSVVGCVQSGVKCSCRKFVVRMID